MDLLLEELHERFLLNHCWWDKIWYIRAVEGTSTNP
jgi:hypothetical protein